MIVRHTLSEPAFVLDDAENFRGFSVDAAGVDLAALDTALQGSTVGKLEGDEALVSIDFVRAGAGDLSSSAEWVAGLENMLAYAQNKGWITEDGAHIRAHIEGAA